MDTSGQLYTPPALSLGAGESPLYQLNRRLGGPYGWLGHYGECRNLLAVPWTIPQFLRRPACILFTILTALLCLLTVQESHTHLHTANRTKCPALLLPTPASERCPWLVQSTSFYHSLFSSSPVLSSDLCPKTCTVWIYFLPIRVTRLSVQIIKFPHLVPFYTILSFSPLNPKS